VKRRGYWLSFSRRRVDHASDDGYVSIMALSTFEWEKVDWTNAVYIPLILAIPVATAVAIYTGIVVTRMVAFQTFKLDAVKEIARLRKTLFDTENLLAALVELTQFLEAPKIGFASEDQWPAARRMREISNRIRKQFKERLETAATEAGFSDKEGVNGPTWRSIQRAVINASIPLIGEAVKEIDSLRPDLWRVLGLRLRNRTLNRLDPPLDSTGGGVI
jgi:hypothetical protein